PPRLARAREPVDEPPGLIPKPPARKRCRVQEHPAGARYAVDPAATMCSDVAHRAITTPDVPQTTQKSPPRIQIESVRPVVGCGRYAPKRTAGDVIDVFADIFRDGHEQLQAVVRFRAPSDRTFTEVPMTALPADRWHGAFTAVELGRYRFTIEAWVDRFASWRDEVRRKVEFGQPDLAGELAE